MAQAHAERAHALLGASKAEQWLNCTPSARIQESIPDRRSQYTEEGTLAHEYAELKLRKRLLHVPNEAAEDALRLDPRYNAEMEQAVNLFVEAVEEAFFTAKARSEDALVILEQRLDFTEWVPEGYGTGDVVIISDGVIEVIDLKYGKGIPVSAIHNPQLRLYALGAIHEFGYLYTIDKIKMTIVQPRLDYIGSDESTVEELLAWGDNVVKPAAQLAFNGEGEFKPGDHCKWCKIKGNCRARADENMKALSYEFREPELLSFDEMGAILVIADRLHTWAKDVENYAFEQVLAGNRINGWKLVEGRSNRSISDKDAVIDAFKQANIPDTEFFKPQELFGLTELEKRIGKKDLAALIGTYIIKPQGKPVLVQETDKRPELNSIHSDFSHIEMEGI
jgi:hypothetical protein